MGRRKYNQGRLDDYSGADMVDPKTRRQALDDYIGRTGWKMTQVQRSEMVDAACRMADKQIATQAEQAERHGELHEVGVDHDEVADGHEEAMGPGRPG